ncbi:HI1506-related protein [Morganella morganii]|uniref:HI1506-related protein n=1 Tax=Morganella morganii TaxID=582 RepID=UPI0032DA3D88
MSDKENLSTDDAGSVIEMAGIFVVNTAHEGYRRAGFILCRGENTLPPVPVSVLTALEADPRLVVTVIAADIHSDTPGRLDNTGTFTAIEQELEQQRLADEKHHQEAEAAEQARQAEELARQEAEAAEQARQAEELARQEAEAAELLRQASEQPSGKGRGKK